MEDFLNVDVRPNKGAEEIIRAMIIQLLSIERVDVAVQEIKEGLIKIVKRSSLRADSPDVFMQVLAGSFLIRCRGIAVEHMDTVLLDRSRIRELRAIVKSIPISG
ncbi:hypothetical protein EOM86_13920 [Candidatus Nomurabacteria bacterium]|nr:hypothetical protein [Candidatus Nomurabacteria bacterium]